jgi:mRNA interferase RelE/StbE
MVVQLLETERGGHQRVAVTFASNADGTVSARPATPADDILARNVMYRDKVWFKDRHLTAADGVAWLKALPTVYTNAYLRAVVVSDAKAAKWSEDAFEIASPAVETLRNLPRTDQRRVAARIDALAENPRPPGVEKLEGADDLYRIRAGDYRIVYRIEDERLIVLVIRIGHRREVYRR